MYRLGIAIALVASMMVGGAGEAEAAEFAKTYDFTIDEWFEIDMTDGPVSLHRIRLDRKEDRLTKSMISRPYNQEYLEPIRFQLDYTNGASEKWRARISVRWLDADGNVIDGFSANETLQKKSANRTVQASVATLKYGIEQAKSLEVVVRFEP